MLVRPRRPADLPAVEEVLRRGHSQRVARLGRLEHPLDHPALLAEHEGRLAGVLTYVLSEDSCEILTLHATEQWRGAGTALVQEVERLAREHGCRRLWVLTTNDNVDALRFYQRRGFRLAALNPAAVDEARARLKPEIPETGNHGIPIRDEIVLELPLVRGGPRAVRGERLCLEPVRPEHAERLRALREAPSVTRWWEPPPEGWPLTIAPDLQAFTVVVDGEVAGYLQFSEEPDPDSRYADVDIFLGPEHQGRGLGSEAMRTMVRHLIDERGHHRITLSTSVDNARAIRSYEKVGFRRVGVMRKAARSHLTGEWEDELLMELVV
jgi:RimJ/RimL family protein N-acetyltransferase